MPSPFPGMDPFLERHWRDVHARLITYAADELQSQLSSDLVARMEERVYVEVDSTIVRDIYPDVRIVEEPSMLMAPSNVDAAGGASLAEPVLLTLESEPVTERFIQIMDADGSRIVTAIEFLSPTNKLPGPGRESYLQKRSEFYDSKANLVEVDLVRTGDWLSMVVPYRVPSVYRSTYRVLVRRASRPTTAELYPIRLSNYLPTIQIPLRPSESDAILNLQTIFNRVYDNGRYFRTDYTLACEPPLTVEEQRSADQWLGPK